MKKIRILFFILSFLILYQKVQALTIGPAKMEFTVDPGEILNFNLFIRNDEEYDAEWYLEVEGFTEENGERKFFQDPPEKNWVEIREKVFLKAKEDTFVPVKINIPKDAPPGGHFLVIWVTSKAPNQSQGGQVGIVGRVGALIFINVKGNTIYKATISKFDAKRIVWNFPVKFSYLIKNEGNTYITPKGYLEIKNIFNKTIASLPINPRELQILPNTEKLLETEWNGSFAFGIYNALFRMEYGENNLLSFNYWFVFLNVYYVIIIVLLLVFVIFILPILIKKYNEYIIKKYAQKS